MGHSVRPQYPATKTINTHHQAAWAQQLTDDELLFQDIATAESSLTVFAPYGITSIMLRVCSKATHTGQYSPTECNSEDIVGTVHQIPTTPENVFEAFHALAMTAIRRELKSRSAALHRTKPHPELGRLIAPAYLLEVI